MQKIYDLYKNHWVYRRFTTHCSVSQDAGHPVLYRYWDATRCVTFMASAAEQALERHLKEETEYLSRYDAIYQRIDRVFDVANADLARLVLFCMDQHGKLSINRRKQYQYKVPDAVFDALEAAYQEVIGQY